MIDYKIFYIICYIGLFICLIGAIMMMGAHIGAVLQRREIIKSGSFYATDSISSDYYKITLVRKGE